MEDEQKAIVINPLPETGKIVKRGRPRKNPIGPGKALGETRPLTKARKMHLEKMRVARREKAKKRKELEASKLIEADNIAGNPGRLPFANIAPALKQDYNQPALASTMNEGILSRSLQDDNYNSNYDINHSHFNSSSLPNGVSGFSSSQGPVYPDRIGHPRHGDIHRGSGTGHINDLNDNGSFYL